MGHNDHSEDDRPELPPDTGKQSYSGFEPDDKWLSSAAPEVQHEAMRQWFLTRYWDPANNTPYNGREGGYQYIHGGPYDAEEELYGRFGEQFTDETIRAVIDDVESDGIDQWAPIHTEPDYDADFEFEANARGDPFRFFQQRLKEVDALKSAELDTPRQPLLRQLLYTSLIAALEAYLSDTMSYWVAVDKKIFRQFVSSCEEFRQHKFSLSEIFDRMEALGDEVEKYLQQLVWHRLDKVVPLMADSLGIQKPAIGNLMKQILVRHDIIHRGGKTKGGKPVTVSSKELDELRGDVGAFIDSIEEGLSKRFPVDIFGLVDDDDLSVAN